MGAAAGGMFMRLLKKKKKTDSFSPLLENEVYVCCWYVY